MNIEPDKNQQAASDETSKRDIATFNFEYLEDRQFQDSSVKEAVLKLDLPKTTIETAVKATEDLKIRQPVTIISRVPQEEETGFIIPRFGIGGRTSLPSEIILYFDPKNPNVITGLQKFRNPQIAHELVHAARKQAGLGNDTLLDKIINEGLATYYEGNWGDKNPTPWGNALPPEQEDSEWAKAKPQLDLPVSEDWFYGKDERHPIWTGYTLGNSILKAYFAKNPDRKMSDVVTMQSKEILEESGFKI